VSVEQLKGIDLALSVLLGRVTRASVALSLGSNSVVRVHLLSPDPSALERRLSGGLGAVQVLLAAGSHVDAAGERAWLNRAKVRRTEDGVFIEGEWLRSEMEQGGRTLGAWLQQWLASVN
jgi:hypothetical protein